MEKDIPRGVQSRFSEVRETAVARLLATAAIGVGVASVSVFALALLLMPS